MKIVNCLIYLAEISVFSFFLGRLLPKKWFKAHLFPWRCLPFEKNGRIYEKLGIRKWQNKVPDMSRILPFLMPEKNLSGDFENRLPRMIQETCVAEFIHGLNCIAGLYCLFLFPGIGGVIVVLVYAIVLNIPFMIIQRYNRPRLVALMRQIEERNTRRTENA